MPATDDELMARASRGETEAFAVLMERHEASVFRYLLRMVGAAPAEDLLQDTFVAAFAARRQYRAPGSVRAWLMAIARNRALNVLRDEARLTVDSEAVGRELERAPGGRDRPERETLRRELRGEIMAGLAALNPARREAIVLRDVEGFSYAEVAEVMAVTEGAARVQVHRAREQLRVLLAPYLAADERSGER